MIPSWVEVFPWLALTDRGVSTRGAEGWTNQPVDTDAEMTTARIDTLAELVITRLDWWTIGQLMPRLRPDRSVDELVLRTSTRTGNMIRRQGYVFNRDLFQEEVRDLFHARNAGVKTVKELLTALIEQCLEVRERQPEADQQAGGPTGSAQSEPGSIGELGPPAGSGGPVPLMSTSTELEALGDMRLIARWLALRGDAHHPLLAQGGVEPGEITRARERLWALTSLDLLPSHSGSDLSNVLGTAMQELDLLDLRILRDRVFADDPVTLDTLARSSGLTRERIRQRESRAVTLLNSLGSAVPELSWVFESARRRIGSLLPLSILLEEIPALGQMVESLAQPAWRVIDRLDDAYEIDAGWCAAGTVSLVRTATRASLDDLADSNGLVPLEDLDKLEVWGTESAPAWAATWIEFCGAVIIKDAVLTRTSSLQDRAAAALAIHGEPYQLEGFPSFVLNGRSERSLANALAADPRFARVDRGRWGLAEWGQGEYTGIADAIRRELESSGGASPLSRIVSVLCGRYDIAERSVRAYASAPPFSVSDGIVRLATSPPSNKHRKSWQQSRRVYRRGDEWIFRFTVNRDHVRGSGSPCPVALAVELAVLQGGQRQFNSDSGGLCVYWTSVQPTLGSVGPYVRELDSALGDEVLLCFSAAGPGKVHAEKVDQALAHPWIAAARLSGALGELSPAAAHEYLAAAVGAPPSASTADLVAILEARREDDLAQLVLEGFQGGAKKEADPDTRTNGPDAGIDEILGLL